LDKVGTEVNIELYQRRITNRLEAVDLAGLDDKEIAGPVLEGFAVTLERLNEKYELLLYRAKTGNPVYVPLPPEEFRRVRLRGTSLG
jgi:hypothetical protein